ncbi:MAG TPA: acetyltransferase [Bryobacteraceae bacterium]|nr:acetyltransferase [Bryobacteraceae bacterium]
MRSTLLAALLTAATIGNGQVLIKPASASEPARILPSDLTILDAGEPRHDLECTVTPEKAQVGFDLRFHAGYDVSVPLRELSGNENMLSIVFRVTPENHPDEALYFTQHVHVPAVDDDAAGDAMLQGSFDLGEGTYHVAWMMRDRSERVCSSYWDTTAELLPKDHDMPLTLGPGGIDQSAGEQFQEEPPVHRVSSVAPFNVKLLVNFAPQDGLSAALPPVDTMALMSIVRSVARDPHFGRFSIVAFNMQEQKVMYRQENVDCIDFPALGQALTSLKLGTVDVKKLGEKHGDTEFLTGLIRKELESDRNHPDAVIFAGPKVMLDANVPQDSLKDVGNVSFPVFYMNYNANPQAMPWKDSISRAVKFFRGYEYTISKPRDLWYAMSDVVSRIVKSRNEKTVSAISSR